MAVEIDLASSETDLQDVKELVFHLYSETVRENIYSIHEYVFGSSEDLSDEVIEEIFEYDDIDVMFDDFDVSDVSDMKEVIEQQRTQIQEQAEMTPQISELFSALVEVIKYVYTGEGYEQAVELQERARANDWNMNVSIELPKLEQTESVL